ncbi:hypothetical protein ACQ4PT_022240 [Festuca glaucescens]
MEPLGAISGRLWSSNDSCSDVGDDEAPSCDASSAPMSLGYLCRSQSPSSSRSLAGSFGSRTEKKVQKRLNQRKAAMEWMAVPSPAVSPNLSFKISSQEKKSSTARVMPRAVMLEPSVFILDEFIADEWILVERKRRSSFQDRSVSTAHLRANRRATTVSQRRRRQVPSSSDHVITGNFKFPFPASHAGHKAQEQRSLSKDILGHEGHIQYAPTVKSPCENGQSKIIKPTRKPLQRVLGLVWSKGRRQQPFSIHATPPSVCSPTRAAMAARGGAQFPSGQGGGGAGSGAPPPNMPQNSHFPRQNSQFERGGGSGYGNGRGATGGNGYGHFNQQNFNNNASGSRGPQNFTPSGRINQGFNGNGNFGGGDRWGQNEGWVGDQNSYDQSSFGGDFGNFNEGYFDGNQGYGQNFNGNAFVGAQRPQRPYRNHGQGGRGRGGRGGRGRFNGRASGGRTPPGIVVGQGTEGATAGQQLLVTPQVQKLVQTVASLQHAVNAQTLQQALQGIQQENISQAIPIESEAVVVANEPAKGVAKKDKLADVICYKCEVSGHFATDCRAVLCI